MIFSWCYTTLKSTIDYSNSNNSNQIDLVIDLEENDDLHSTNFFTPLLFSEILISNFSFQPKVVLTSFQSSISATVSPFLYGERIIAISIFLI